MDWDDLKYVLEIVRNGGVTAAARRLGVNHATVSRRISAMEKRAGVRLFDRLPSGFSPTSAGLEAVIAAERMEEAVQKLDRQLDRRDVRTEGHVTLTAPLMLLASKPFMHMVEDLKLRFPGIVLRLVASIDLLNLHQREADIAIRSTETPDENLFGLKFSAIRAAAYAAPSYLEMFDASTSAADMQWVGHLTGNRLNALSSEYYDDKPLTLSANDKLVAASAAKAGLGVANLPCYYGDSEDGLKRVEAFPMRAYGDLWILTHPDLSKVARIRAVMRTLADSAKRYRPLFEGRLGKES